MTSAVISDALNIFEVFWDEMFWSIEKPEYYILLLTEVDFSNFKTSCSLFAFRQ